MKALQGKQSQSLTSKNKVSQCPCLFQLESQRELDNLSRESAASSLYLSLRFGHLVTLLPQWSYLQPFHAVLGVLQFCLVLSRTFSQRTFLIHFSPPGDRVSGEVVESCIVKWWDVGHLHCLTAAKKHIPVDLSKNNLIWSFNWVISPCTQSVTFLPWCALIWYDLTFTLSHQFINHNNLNAATFPIKQRAL